MKRARRSIGDFPVPSRRAQVPTIHPLRVSRGFDEEDPGPAPQHSLVRSISGLANQPNAGKQDPLNPANVATLVAAQAEVVCKACGRRVTNKLFCSEDGELVSGPFTLGDRYEVSGPIGAGACAIVFAAQQKLIGKPVAIKLLRGHTVEEIEVHRARFLREARASSVLTHENIVNVTDFGEDKTLAAPFLVMERLRGETLGEAIAREAPMDWRRAAGIMLQICRGLAVAHKAGLIHRDLKPQNIFLEQSSGRDVVKICDFGISRLAAEDQRLTQHGQVVGTPAYASPEQIVGDTGLDHRADIYALGATAYEMLSGSLTHDSSTSIMMIASKLVDPAIDLRTRTLAPNAPSELIELVMNCLAIDPSQRPESVRSVEEQLLTLLGQRKTVAPLNPRGLIGQFAGSYRIDAVRGIGATGAVYQASHPVLQNQVAVKVLLPEVLNIPGVSERFVNEARLSRQIQSPYVPQIFDFGTLETGQAFAVMELLEGETLGARLVREGRLPLTTTISILQQAAAALGAVHKAGIIHRDVKPENLFLVGNDESELQVKLLDFGIARLATPEVDAAKLTRLGVFVGTPIYAPPEQLMAQAASPLVDMYALGVTGYEMLTGAPPFTGDLSNILSQKMDGLVTLSHHDVACQPLLVLLTDMMAMSASNRPANMSEVVARLSSLATDAKASNEILEPAQQRRGASPSERADAVEDEVLSQRGWLSRNVAWLAATVAVAVVVITVLLWPSAKSRDGSSSAVTAPATPVQAEVPTEKAVTQPTQPLQAETQPQPTAQEPTAAPGSAAEPTPTSVGKKQRSKTVPSPAKPRAVPTGTPTDVIIANPYKDSL